MSHEETRWAIRCPVCTGDIDAEPCDGDCARAVREAHVHGLHRHADKCRTFIKLYLVHDRRDGLDPRDDHRIVGLLSEIRRAHEEIRVVRWAMTPNESFGEAAQ